MATNPDHTTSKGSTEFTLDTAAELAADEHGGAPIQGRSPDEQYVVVEPRP